VSQLALLQTPVLVFMVVIQPPASCHTQNGIMLALNLRLEQEQVRTLAFAFAWTPLNFNHPFPGPGHLRSDQNLTCVVWDSINVTPDCSRWAVKYLIQQGWNSANYSWTAARPYCPEMSGMSTLTCFLSFFL